MPSNLKVVPQYKVTERKKKGPERVRMEDFAPAAPVPRSSKGVRVNKAGLPKPVPQPFPTKARARDPDEPEHRTMSDAERLRVGQKVWRLQTTNMVGAEETKRLEQAAMRKTAARKVIKGK